MSVLTEIRDAIVASGEYTTVDQYEQLLCAFKDISDYYGTLRLIWDCGMSIAEICSIRVKDINSYKQTINIPPAAFVLPRASRTVYVNDSSIFDLFQDYTGHNGTAWIFPTATRTAGNVRNPKSFAKIIYHTAIKKTGIKATQTSLFRGKLVSMVDSGTIDLYDITRFFGTENMTALKIMHIDSTRED